MKNSNDKVCRKCVHYRVYYAEGYCFFYKTREGFCKKSRGIVNECDACGLWKKAPPAAVATEEIDTLMKDFAALQILYQATEETSSP